MMDSDYAHRQIIESGMFVASAQPSTGSTCYTLDGHKFASIYVHKSGDIHIRFKALENTRFPETINATLRNFVHDHHYDTTRERDPVYILHREHIDAIINIIYEA